MMDMKKLVGLYAVAVSDLRKVPTGNVVEASIVEAAMTTAEAAVIAAGVAEAATVEASVAEALALAHRPS